MDPLLDWIVALDTALFYAINLNMANGFLDLVMVWITDKHNWYVPGVVLVGWLIWRRGRYGTALVVMAVVGLVLGDQISAGVLKPFFERIRPCKTLDGFRMLTHCGSLYGFPSSHAANSAVLAAIMAYGLPRARLAWLVLALLVGLSRIYVGVHYPLDVVGGWLLGVGLALLVILVYRHAVKRFPSLTRPA